MELNWRFKDDPDTEVFTLARIIDGEATIRLVTHDAEDGAWQFLDGEAVLTSDGAMAALGEMVAVDASLSELADLPLGWYAWRDAPDSPWERHEGEPEGG